MIKRGNDKVKTFHTDSSDSKVDTSAEDRL